MEAMNAEELEHLARCERAGCSHRPIHCLELPAGERPLGWCARCRLARRMAEDREILEKLAER